MLFFVIKKPCPVLRMSPVPWVRLQTFKFIYLHKQADPEQLNVDHSIFLFRVGIEPAIRSAAIDRSATAPTVPSNSSRHTLKTGKLQRCTTTNR